ncbi:MAG: glycerol-3-phosphate 1-O-acyltransferase PlsY [Alphaproteobacteria bacterium]|nr:glycerol-3-phosphate 1-O-acyltransferase PlsY [Alphaproteobacteria bacterium]MBL6937790.1 glycerol-3-phosphate 1-O-acyltransferase PlsY [Alphaproteobacteria bacterium]MBL7099384.1 glycerol-3-phosphate 1-O-acyltransferase PlsY [Alphaproteobacteria bacterium]
MTSFWTLEVGWPDATVSLLTGYLLGSIPFGLILSFAFGEGDVRKIGSHSIGATNVLRTGNYAAAGLTLLFDALKGVAAVLLVRHFFGDDAALFAALGAFLGHLFPLWLGFKGGKGIAVSLGILLAINWPVALIAFASWGAVLAVFRISSLSALVAAVLTPIYMVLFHRIHEAELAVLLAVLVFIAHRENIRRLLNGTEPKVGGSKSAATS